MIWFSTGADIPVYVSQLVSLPPGCLHPYFYTSRVSHTKMFVDSGETNITDILKLFTVYQGDCAIRAMGVAVSLLLFGDGMSLVQWQ